MYQYFKCMACKAVRPVDEAVNKPWTGWKNENGQTITMPINNFCCPDCESNDLTWREAA